MFLLLVLSLLPNIVTDCDRENHQHLKYFWNVIVVQEKSQSGVRKLNHKQDR